MKVLCLILLVAFPLFAQVESPVKLEPGILAKELAFIIFQLLSGEKDEEWANEALNYLDDILPTLFSPLATSPSRAKQASPVLIGSASFPFSAVYPVVAPFYNQFPNGEVKYNSLFQPRSASVVNVTNVQPVAPPDPRIVFLDGLGNSIVAIDMTTLAVVSQVVVPSTVGPFGIRPSATSTPNEVWVANSGLEVSVVDLGAQSLLANILTSSIPRSVAPAGIVFTNDGGTAFEAVKYFSPDSSGNNGALLVFDALSRTLTSTLPLKFAPTALLMAPDGLTAYLLSDTSTLTYYDVLSGTADLTVSTLTPGSSAGYNPFGQVYIHPDGSRLLWSAGGQLQIFDLTTRTVTNRFSFGLPSTVAAGAAMTMSQDGGRVYVSDVLGDVVILDTLYGTILESFNTGAATSVFGGPPLAP